MKVLIVDDEAPLREGLQKLLRTFCPEVTEIRQAEGVASALATLSEYRPDILFVDVEMGDGTGIQLVRSLGEIPFQVVFITAFNKYAVDAFRLSAVDYLMKPVSPDELAEAVRRAQRALDSSQQMKALSTLQERTEHGMAVDSRIALREQEHIHLVKVSEIIYCEADGGYTRFHLTQERVVMVSRNLKEYDELLASQGFMRIHHSFLANMAKVSTFNKLDGGSLIMEGGASIPVSQRKKDAVLEFFKQF